MKRYFLFLLIVAPLLYLLAFGLTRNAKELPSMMVGKPAPDFELQTLEGKTVTRRSLEGRPLVINFWATWCGPCFFEHGVFKEVRDRYAKDHAEKRVAFLGVVYQDKKEAVAEFLKEHGAPFTVVFDPSSKMAIAFGVGGVPETFFVDAAGVIRSKFTGVLSVPQLEGQLKKLDMNPRARAIADQLRCPVCRGIPIAESPSELARDMMTVIRQKLEAGETDEQILAYFEDRYGEWILLRPKAQGLNLMIWILPAALLIAGGVIVFISVRKWTRT